MQLETEDPPNLQLIQEFAKKMGIDTQTRFTVILPDGSVIADSDKTPTKMENPLNRPEISEALKGQVGVSTRYSYTVKKNLMYVAIPLLDANGSTSAIIRSSSYADVLVNQLKLQKNRNLLVLVMILAVAGILAWAWTRQVIGPIHRLKKHIEQLAHGNLNAKFDGSSTLPKEFSSVIKALNRIAGEFDSSKNEILQNQIQQGAILSNMGEGVIAISPTGKINHINTAAAKILGISYNEENDLSAPELILQLVRLPVLQKFIKKSLEEKTKQEREIYIDEIHLTQKIFIVRSSPIHSLEGAFQGTIFVFLDMTELRKLERHRQEFVSNVSHELKTPLTSIKGFAETMQNPTLNSVSDLKRYSAIIQKHADQLDTLIDDLLTLSKLENEMELENDDLQKIQTSQIIQATVEICQRKAEHKNINIKIEENTKTETLGNLGLLTQALVNLVDNAIKYSPNNTVVRITTSSINQTEKNNKTHIRMEVTDQGPGIASHHLPHLFERFYRVDKGRAREMGGTGLGLSIVKHIINVHGGIVGVESNPSGSMFFLQFPTDLTQI